MLVGLSKEVEESPPMDSVSTLGIKTDPIIVGSSILYALSIVIGKFQGASALSGLNLGK